MPDQDTRPADSPPTPGEIRQQIFRRVLLAIALILAAVVVINALNRLKASQQALPDNTVVPAATLKVRPEPRPSTPETPVSLPEAPASALDTASSDTAASEPLARIDLPASTPTKPVQLTQAPLKTVAPSAPSQPVLTTQAVPTPPRAPKPTTVIPPTPTRTDLPGTPLLRPSLPPTAPKDTPHLAPLISTSHAIIQTGSGKFILQAGLFQTANNANQLADKLRAAGLPVQVETRVTLGPFKTRAEAEKARAQLAGLGLAAQLSPQSQSTTPR